MNEFRTNAYKALRLFIFIFIAIILFYQFGNFLPSCVENRIHQYVPQTLTINLAPDLLTPADSIAMSDNVYNYARHYDKTLQGLHKINLQSGSGANQLFLFLQFPYWSSRNIVIYLGDALLVILLLFLGYRYIKRLQELQKLKKWWWSIPPILLLMALVNVSIPLSSSTQVNADVVFVFVCFLCIGISLVAFYKMWQRLLNEKFFSEIRLVRLDTRHSTLMWAAISAWFLAYLVFFIGMYSGGSQKSLLAAVFRPAFSASKMFFMADNTGDIATVLRLSGGFMGFYILVKIIVLIVTSSTLLLLVFNRWQSYLKMKMEDAKGKKLFVFFGITRPAQILARDIKSKEAGNVVLFIENRNAENNLFKSVSFSGILSMFRHRGDVYDIMEDMGAHLIVSNAMMSSPECANMLEKMKTSDDTSCGLGLKHFLRMAKNAAEVHCFFMYDDQHTNISGANNLRKLLNSFKELCKTVKIHCWARQNARTQVLEIPLSNDKTEIKILDSSQLSVQYLLRSSEHHPVNFVEVDTQTATVKSDLNALIIGFGETGQDALKFLYEFGAFLDKSCADEKGGYTFRSPFHCDVIDKDMDTLRPSFLSKVPALMQDAGYNWHQVDDGRWVPDKDSPLVTFHTGCFNSETYLNLICQKIVKANYILLALGNDELNLQALSDLMDIAVKLRDKDFRQMRIFVRCYSNDYSKVMMDMENDFNQMFPDNKPVKMFGMEKDIFSYDIIINEDVMKNAEAFYEKYREFKKDPKDKTWKERDSEKYSYKWESRCKVKRQEQQDINNYLHIGTKLRLAFDVLPNEDLCRKWGDGISFKTEGRNYVINQKEFSEIYTNLARTEHLRWMASHEMMGYVPNADTCCKEIEKSHNCLVSWEELPAVTESHNEADKDYPVDYIAYDYIVVKTTFMLELDRLTKEKRTSEITNTSSYIPRPVDTKDVKLPEELETLVEQMSENVHEVWAETRIRQGWTYGEQRNDMQKTHPCLVPYEELPEEEKEYDRNTSIGTLKLIMKLGFKIKKKGVRWYVR